MKIRTNKTKSVLSKISKGIISLLTVLLIFGCTTVETMEDGKVTKKTVSILGYNLGPPAREDGIYKLYIPRIGNQSKEPHLQMEATNLIINEFTKEQSYYIVPRPDEADGVLNVVITKISMSPIRYVDRKINKNAAGVPLEFRVVVYANVEMQNAKSKKTVWRLKDNSVERWD